MISYDKARASDAQIISALAIRSKAHWGYDEEFMSNCVIELSHTAQDIQNDNYKFVVLKTQECGKLKIVGFYKLENLDNKEILLEALFIDTNEIGKGYGKMLFEHAKSAAVRHGASSLILQSDPHAEGFYQAQGMQVIGKEESKSIPGRFLSTYILNIT